MEKKLAIWGIGNISKQYKDLTGNIPDIYIDSFSKVEEYNGVKVVRFEEIYDKENYYYVVMIENFEPIFNVLKDAGLKEKIDYDSYLNYYTYAYANNNIVDWDCIDYKSKKVILICAPIFLGRQIPVMINFWKEYIRNKNAKGYECVAIDDLGILTPQMAGEYLDKAIVIPTIKDNSEDFSKWLKENDVQRWKGYATKILKEYTYDKAGLNINIDNLGAYFSYYEYIINKVEPTQIITWSDSIQSVVIRSIADEKNIDYKILEYGELPGTIMIDNQGICHKSEYANKSSKYEQIIVDNKDLDQARNIKKYIIDNKLDTGVFSETSHDENQLKKLDTNKKTIMFFGNGGLSFRVDSSDWKTKLSSWYIDDYDVLPIVDDICKRNNYNLIFKPHPGRKVPEEILQSLVDIIYIYDKSVDDLIAKSDVIISSTVAVGYKTLMYEKPLVQLTGNLISFGKNCEYDVYEKDDLEEIINQAMMNGLTEKQKKNFDIFIAKMLKNHMWDDLSPRELRYGNTFDKEF